VVVDWKPVMVQLVWKRVVVVVKGEVAVPLSRTNIDW
jgi:hypothetical protein